MVMTSMLKVAPDIVLYVPRISSVLTRGHEFMKILLRARKSAKSNMILTFMWKKDCNVMHYPVFSEFGVALTELTLEHDGLLQIRQMAALLLKQYVDTHWSSLSEKFKGPETSVQAKATIRSMYSKNKAY